ncbi:3-oxoacyl-[acyl-carrier-protein] reductase FabG [Gottschalkia purinilytica]|uniref:3-oxoacyl-[acyl-carrier-protein] reductase FabG n=1 Tax=Gottschalkia purinilytica TaxID=1503 RepID=A0A0L0W735_GOTPU|nr:SDR family oxidoreductase [Gottschalkia purinilytica]KNF07363.1 3-oxoacyl-[acyl-carrier-protein] reductase FabG [Gottschalkia purinilytica]
MASLKTVLVTGASKGIGQATADLLAHEGYNVIINFNKSEKEALSLYNKLKNKGLSVRIYKANVSKKNEVKDMIDFCIKEFGTIDILINNAGISQEKLFVDITDEDWDNMINTNLKSVFYCTQEVLKHMISKKRGKIINISSIWGMIGASCEAHYSAAKAGVIGLTKALAKEMGPSNIQINCITPGVIQTGMLDSYNQNELNVLRENTPLMKLGSPKDIANCVLFLVSNRADFITGQVISPNGGFVV